MKISITSQVKLWAQEIDFDLIKSNFAQFEAIQATHKVTAASAVKYGGVLESLPCYIWGTISVPLFNCLTLIAA